jgi:hypothetical protein
MPQCRQNGAYQSCGDVNRGLRSHLAHDDGDVPLPEPVKRAILASKSPGMANVGLLVWTTLWSADGPFFAASAIRRLGMPAIARGFC